MKPTNLMIDSGAFSAYTQGKEVVLDNYCEFVNKNRSVIDTVVNLDVINPKDPEVAAAAGMVNLARMLDKGIKAMPVYHARESVKHLNEMLDLGYDYIGLSGTSLVSPVESRNWHEMVWSYITDTKGRPVAKFHGFGDTAPYSLLNYPWYSADSATWMIMGGLAGRVKLNGKPYQVRANTINDISYLSMGDSAPQKDAWYQEIRNLGLNPELLMTTKVEKSEMAMLRTYLVASDLLRLQEQTATVRTFKKPISIIGQKIRNDNGLEREGMTQVYFVISPSAWFFNFPIIASLGIKNVLVSYYYLVDSSKNFWEERLIPFLNDPVGYCANSEQLRPYWDKLNEVVLPEWRNGFVPVEQIVTLT